MFEFIKAHQLDIMLVLCAISVFASVLLLFTGFLPKRRKFALILMQLISAMLLGFDRLAYIYREVAGTTDGAIVRISNLIVFLMTSATVFGFNVYLVDLIQTKTDQKKIPLALKIVGIGSLLSMLGVVISHFTGFYYYFDENNNKTL